MIFFALFLWLLRCNVSVCVYMIKISDLDMTTCFVSLFSSMKKDKWTKGRQKKESSMFMQLNTVHLKSRHVPSNTYPWFTRLFNIWLNIGMDTWFGKWWTYVGIPGHPLPILVLLHWNIFLSQPSRSCPPPSALLREWWPSDLPSLAAWCGNVAVF